MIESLVGVEVTATRQKGGKPVNGVADPGGVKLPPVTACAVVTVACGSVNDARPVQLVPAKLGAPARKKALRQADDTTNDFKPQLMAFLPMCSAQSRRDAGMMAACCAALTIISAGRRRKKAQAGIVSFLVSEILGEPYRRRLSFGARPLTSGAASRRIARSGVEARLLSKTVRSCRGHARRTDRRRVG
ncbi:MAG TPA: hypothetical protein VET85_10965 [Stellaceae bacterium]|nr:hypothetical protein [Stellaceae bacterium]